MLRNSELGTREDWEKNSDTKAVPSYTQSIFKNLSVGFATPAVAVKNLDSNFAASPSGHALRSAMDAVNIANENPRMVVHRNGWCLKVQIC